MIHSLFARRPTCPVPAVVKAVHGADRPEAIPTLSDTVVRAVAVATDPDATLADFVALARRDAAVTALLIKRANSAAAGGEVTDVGQAVVWLGLQTCGQLAAAVGLRDVLRGYPAGVRERCETILAHSLFVAHMAAHLNRLLALGFRGEEFTGGLLHDIGRVILSARWPADAVRVDPLDYAETPRRLAREQSAFGTNHCVVGAAFADQNGLPAVVGRVILHHHDAAGEEEHRRLVALVATADGVANYLQRCRKLRGYDPTADHGYATLSGRWEGRDHGRFRTVLPEALRSALRDTRGTLRSFAV
jgi:putative nucleotidyltransferase with HDIG domain